MEIGRDGDERAADEIEAEPYDDEAREGGNPRSQGGKAKARGFYFSGACEFGEAGGADDAFVVLGDAFAAEKTAAFGATRDGFAAAVVQAALEGERGHQGGGSDCTDSM